MNKINPLFGHKLPKNSSNSNIQILNIIFLHNKVYEKVYASSWCGSLVLKPPFHLPLTIKFYKVKNGLFRYFVFMTKGRLIPSFINRPTILLLQTNVTLKPYFLPST